MRFAMNRSVVVDALRTAVAAVLALAIARLLGFREAWWAPISTIVIVLSSPGAEWSVSWQRFIGTAVGSGLAAIVATEFRAGSNATIPVFAAGIFVLGLLCSLLRLDRAAYRFAGIALAVIVLVPRNEPAWIAALHRFIEVSLGIAVGLLMTWMWPEKGKGK
jgi:uncharacterized membrane protein YgaE (UPF0421/DUF939 family)